MTPSKDPWFRNRLIRDASYQAVHEMMTIDENIYLMGEGSHMKVHFDAPAIERDFPERILTMPISEDANGNFAVGASLAGVVPVVDVISSDFLFRCMDSICNTMAKAACISYPRTMIVRAEFLIGGPTAGQRIESLFAHVPGLRVAIPSNPQDAYDLMRQALVTKGVTLYFEDRMIADAATPERYKSLTNHRPHFGARVALQGKRATVVSYGLGCQMAEQALEGQDCTLIDLRTLWPLDIQLILSSVLETGKLVIVEPGQMFMGVGAEIAALVAQAWPGVYIARLGAPRVTIPASRELHDQMFVTPEELLATIAALEGTSKLGTREHHQLATLALEATR